MKYAAGKLSLAYSTPAKLYAPGVQKDKQDSIVILSTLVNAAVLSVRADVESLDFMNRLRKNGRGMD